MPAGKKGYAWTFGGMGLAVSRYSKHPKLAAQVVRYLVSVEVEKGRLLASYTIPSRTSLFSDPGLLRNTAYNGWLGQHWELGMFTRPAAITGKKYEMVSIAYSAAVHDVIAGKQDPHKALEQLQAKLVAILR